MLHVRYIHLRRLGGRWMSQKFQGQIDRGASPATKKFPAVFNVEKETLNIATLIQNGRRTLYTT